MSQPSFRDRVVIVTGASSGVGEAAARRFAALGAKVVLAARSAAKIEAVAKEIGGLAVATDVTSLPDLENLVQRTVEAHGRIDVLVNNAGANSRGDLGDVAVDEIASVVDTNLKAPILLTRLALPHLKASKGVVVNVASIAGHVPLPGESTYCATKWGLRGFTFAVTEECRDAGVALTVVSPGPIATPFVLDDLDQTPDLVFSQPFLTAEQVAEAVVACAADRRRERAIPPSTLWLAKLIGLAPWLQRWLRPMLEARGRKAKDEWRAKLAAR
ncbi:MAG TPA: SDR family oxidoreductase [Myxococcota bacterium]|nr:SDR family oxidoreductase [Myxococcota bacterium]